MVSVTFPRADVAEPITVACDCIIRKQIKTFFLSFSLSFEIAEVRFYMYTIYQSLHLNLLHISNDYLLLDCLRFWAVDPVEPIVHWFNIKPHPPGGGVSLQSVKRIYVLSDSLTYRLHNNLTGGCYAVRKPFHCNSLTEQLIYPL